MILAYETSGTSLDDKQAGELLGLHPKTMQRLARRGEIPALPVELKPCWIPSFNRTRKTRDINWGGDATVASIEAMLGGAGQ
jgi:hypothetical protein